MVGETEVGLGYRRWAGKVVSEKETGEHDR